MQLLKLMTPFPDSKFWTFHYALASIWFSEEKISTRQNLIANTREWMRLWRYFVLLVLWLFIAENWAKLDIFTLSTWFDFPELYYKSKCISNESGTQFASKLQERFACYQGMHIKPTTDRHPSSISLVDEWAPRTTTSTTSTQHKQWDTRNQRRETILLYF
jgi:hypothetical protein